MWRLLVFYILTAEPNIDVPWIKPLSIIFYEVDEYPFMLGKPDLSYVRKEGPYETLFPYWYLFALQLLSIKVFFSNSLLSHDLSYCHGLIIWESDYMPRDSKRIFIAHFDT